MGISQRIKSPDRQYEFIASSRNNFYLKIDLDIVYLGIRVREKLFKRHGHRLKNLGFIPRVSVTLKRKYLDSPRYVFPGIIHP